MGRVKDTLLTENKTNILLKNCGDYQEILQGRINPRNYSEYKFIQVEESDPFISKNYLSLMGTTHTRITAVPITETPTQVFWMDKALSPTEHSNLYNSYLKRKSLYQDRVKTLVLDEPDLLLEEYLKERDRFYEEPEGEVKYKHPTSSKICSCTSKELALGPFSPTCSFHMDSTIDRYQGKKGLYVIKAPNPEDGDTSVFTRAQINWALKTVSDSPGASPFRTMCYPQPPIKRRVPVPKNGGLQNGEGKTEEEA